MGVLGDSLEMEYIFFKPPFPCRDNPEVCTENNSHYPR